MSTVHIVSNFSTMREGNIQWGEEAWRLLQVSASMENSELKTTRQIKSFLLWQLVTWALQHLHVLCSSSTLCGLSFGSLELRKETMCKFQKKTIYLLGYNFRLKFILMNSAICIITRFCFLLYSSCTMGHPVRSFLECNFIFRLQTHPSCMRALLIGLTQTTASNPH